MGSCVTSLCFSCPIAQRYGACPAVQPRYQKNSPLKYLILGEAPGANEEQQGEPFVGRSGALLKKLLADAGIDINDCLLTNTTWCAPRELPNDPIGTPTSGEALHCLPHSLHFVQYYRPRVIIPTGRIPYEALCGKSKKGETITKHHGYWKRMALDVLTRYRVMAMWVAENSFDQRFPALEVDDEEGQEQQLKQAHEEGYDESWMDTPVFPVVHPSFVLQAKGQRARWEEATHFDFVKLRNAVEETPIDEVVGAGLTEAELEELNSKYRWINDIESLEAYVDETLKYFEDGTIECMALDVETTTLDFSEMKNPGDGIGLLPYSPEVRVLMVQISRFKDEGVAIMANHKKSNFNDPVLWQKWLQQIKRLVTVVPVVGQNFTFDAHVFRTFFNIDGIKVVGDTMLMDHFYNMGQKLPHNLDALGARYVSAGVLHKRGWKDWESKNPGAGMEDAPLDIMLGYAVGDTDVTLQVYYCLRALLTKEGSEFGTSETRWQSYFELHHGVHDAWRVISDLEWYGMPVDKPILDDLRDTYPMRIAKCFQQLNELPFVATYMHECMLKKNTEATEKNESIATNRAAGIKERRHDAKVWQFQEWWSDKKRWFNPGSWQQCHMLWLDVLELPLYMDEFKDLKWNDACPRCNRDKCRCKGEKYVNIRPKTDEPNRNIIRDVALTWAKAADKNGEESKACHWRMIADLMEVHNEFKMLMKMYGTYVNGIYPLIIDRPKSQDEYDPFKRESVFYLYRDHANFPAPWTVHPSFLMHGTETGRQSSKAPNAQNFPKRKMDPRANVKRPYVSRWAGRGGLILQPDYSQIEVRVMVMMCGDTNLAAQINEGKDIHMVVASMVHGIPYEKVTKDLRDPCKQITFGILYGMSVASVARELKITHKEAQDLQDRFFEQLPKVRAFKDYMESFVKEHGYVETLHGRRRYIEEINADTKAVRTRALRLAVNTPIQGTASDMNWSAYGRAWRRILSMDNLEAYPYSIIHDSQTFDVAPGQFMDVAELQYYHMVYEPYELWPWVTVKPEADFEIGAGFGRLVGMKVHFADDSPDHQKIALYGPKDDVQAVHDEILASGQGCEQLVDGLHPEEKEAEKGIWWKELSIDRSNSVCWLENKQLILRK